MTFDSASIAVPQAMTDETTAIHLAAVRLVRQLEAQGKTLALAESCTGGAVASALTAVAGASTIFSFGFVVYGNRAKESLLGVSEVSLKNLGAVSRTVAEEMAQGALLRAESDLALSLTGIAGPTGGSVDKPLGTVWFALAARAQVQTPQVETPQVDPQIKSVRQVFDGTRAEVRHQATLFALAWLLEETAKQ